MENKTVNYKDLYNEILRAEAELRQYHKNIGLEDLETVKIKFTSFWNEPIKAHAFISGLDTLDVEYAKKIADLIVFASQLAENFKYNGYKEVY